MTLPGALYHYCSTAAFVEIVRGGKVWLSSMNQSNDSLEGMILPQVIARMALKDQLPNSWSDRMNRDIKRLRNTMDGLRLCMSRNGDSLSQWRAYGSDGAGVAVGFSVDFLRGVGVPAPSPGVAPRFLVDVLYEEAEQEARSSTLYDLLKEATALYRSEKESDREANPVDENDLGVRTFYETVMLQYTFKPAAFREEQEVRLISPALDSWDRALQYHSREKALIPHEELTLPLGAGAITSVVLGPKHQSPEKVITRFLLDNGCRPEPKVVRSAASYR